MQQSKRRLTTVHLKPGIARAMKKRAALNDQTIGDVVNEMLAEHLKHEARHLKIFRMRQDESGRPLEDVLRDMERDGLL